MICQSIAEKSRKKKKKKRKRKKESKSIEETTDAEGRFENGREHRIVIRSIHQALLYCNRETEASGILGKPQPTSNETTDKDKSFLVGGRGGGRHAKVNIYSSGQLSKGNEGRRCAHLLPPPLDTVLFRESRKIIHLIVLHRPCSLPFASDISSSSASPSLLNRRKVRGENRKGVRKEGRKRRRGERRKGSRRKKSKEKQWNEGGNGPLVS